MGQLRASLARIATPPGSSTPDRIRALLSALSLDEDRYAAVAAEMLGLTDAAAEPRTAAAEAQIKSDVTRLTLDAIDALTRDGVAVAIFEDAHWIDPSTADVLRELCLRARDRRMLVLVTSRWTDGLAGALGEHVEHVPLDRLNRTQAEGIIDAMTGSSPLAAQVVESIIDRAAGVPLFVEELTRAAIDVGADALESSGKPDDMPLLVRDSLVARLDGLGSARRVARTASALGRSFSHALLEAVSALAGDQLVDSLEALERAGVLQRVFGDGEAAYAFRHDLLRNAAYDLMLRDERIDLHARIALAIEGQFEDVARLQPELLARHYGEARMFPESIAAWLRGGRRAASRSSFSEAISAYDTAIGLLEHLPDDTDREETEMQLRLGLGEAHAGAVGFASPPAGEAYTHALETAARLDVADAKLQAYPGLFGFHHMGGRLEQAKQVAREFHETAEQHGRLIHRVAATRTIGCAAFSMAEHETAERSIRRAIELYDMASPAELEHATINAQDQKTTSLCYLPLILAVRGDPTSAWEASQEGIAHSEQLGHIHSIGYSLTFATGLAATLEGRGDELADLAERAMGYARDEQFPNWRMARVFHALSLAEGGAVEEGLVEMQAGFASYGATGGLIFAPTGMRHLARALALAGQHEEAIATLDRGLGLSSQTGEIWSDPWLLSDKGHVLTQTGDGLAAASTFEQAIATARAQGATLFELRAVAGLARLRLTEGRTDEARAVLSSTCARFDDAAVFPELGTARSLLQQVA